MSASLREQDVLGAQQSEIADVGYHAQDRTIHSRALARVPFGLSDGGRLALTTEFHRADQILRTHIR